MNRKSHEQQSEYSQPDAGDGTLGNIKDGSIEQYLTVAKRYAAILSQVNLGILILSEDERVEFLNQAFCEQFGIPEPPSSFIGVMFDRFGTTHTAC
jgi:PAS domain-containing protein